MGSDPERLAQREQPDGDHRVRMTFLTACLKHFGRWLLSMGPAAEVLEPEALQAEMVQLSEDLFLHYRKNVPVPKAC